MTAAPRFDPALLNSVLLRPSAAPGATPALAVAPDRDGDPSADMLATYFRRLRGAGISENTIAVYQLYLTAFARRVALDEASADDANAFLAAERARVKASARGGDGGATAQSIYKTLRVFYGWAEEAGLVDHSPMRTVPAPKDTISKITPVPSVEQVRQVIAFTERDKTFAGKRDAAMMRLMCELGGPRREEIARMRVTDVDIRAGRVLVHGKGGQDRLIPITGKTPEALMRYLAARRKHKLAKSPMLWLGERGCPLTGNGIYQMFRRRSAAAGCMHLHPHMFRHYSGAQAKRNKLPTAAANALFGWKKGSRMYDEVYGAFADAETALQMADELALGDQL